MEPRLPSLPDLPALPGLPGMDGSFNYEPPPGVPMDAYQQRQGPIDPADSFLDDLWDSFRRAAYYEPLAAISSAAGSAGFEGGFDKAERIGQQLATDPSLQTSDRAGELVGTVLGSAVQPAVAAAATAAGGPVGAAAAGATIAGMGAQAYGAGVQRYRNYKEQRGEEINPLTEKVVGLGFGAAEFMAERFGAKALSKVGVEGAQYLSRSILKRAASVDPQATASALRRLLTSETSARLAAGAGQAAVVEGSTEAATQAAQNLWEIAWYDDGRRDNWIKGTLEGVPQAAGIGALVGPIAAGAAGAVGIAKGGGDGTTPTAPTEREQLLRQAGVTPDDEYGPLKWVRRNLRSGGLVGQDLKGLSRRQERQVNAQMKQAQQTTLRLQREVQKLPNVGDEIPPDLIRDMGQALNGGDVEIPAAQREQFQQEAMAEAQAREGDTDQIAEQLYLDKVKEREREMRRENRQEALAKLPEPVAEEVQTMRGHIDALSREMERAGVISGSLQTVFDANIGIYARRSYAAIEEGINYGEVDPEVVNRWRSFARTDKNMREGFFHGFGKTLVDEQMQRMGTDDRDAAIAELTRQLRSGEAKSMEGYFDRYADSVGQQILQQAQDGFAGRNTSNLKITSTVAGILKQRQDLPKVMRDLLGEYNDPRTVYLHTIQRQARLLSQFNMLAQAKEQFKDILFFEDPLQGPAGLQPIDAEGGPAMQPLEGMYTFPEVQEWFNEQSQVQPIDNAIIAGFAKGVTAAKEAATRLSAATQARNNISMFLPMVASGHLFTRKGLHNVSRGFKAAYAGVLTGVVGKDRTITLDRGGKTEKQALLDYLGELWEFGLLDNDPRTGDIDVLRQRAGMREMGNLLKAQLEDDATLSGARKKWRAISDFSARAYQAGDGWAKVAAFESEFASLREAEMQKPPGERRGEFEIKREAADRARKTQFAYDELPKITDFFRQNAFIAPFVSFPVAVLRSSYYNARFAMEDLQTPGRRKMGARRALGLASAIAVPGATARAVAEMINVDQDDEEDLRRFMAPWDRASQVLFTAREPGKISFINTTYTDPYGWMKEPFIALLKGAEEDRTALEFVRRWLEPFISEELLTQRFVDLARNADATNGQPIYNPEAEIGEKAQDMISHVLEALEPGTLRTMGRVIKGVRGAQSVYGTAPDPMQELRGFAGVKEKTLDINQSLYFKAQEFSRARRDAAQIFTSVAHRRGRVGLGELASAKGRSARVRQELWAEMMRDLEAARRLGLTDDEIFATVTSVTGFGKKNAQAMLRGRYVPYDYNEDNLRRRMETVAATTSGDDRLRNLLQLQQRQRALQALDQLGPR